MTVTVTQLGGSGGTAEVDDTYQWLLDFKTFGEESYAYVNGDIRDEMMRSRAAANDLRANGTAFEYVCATEEGVGAWLAQVYGMGAATTLKALDTIDDVANSESAISAVAASSISP